LTKQGVQTGEAVTGLVQVIQAIISPTAEARKTAEELGISFGLAAMQGKTLGEYLQELYEATNGNMDAMNKLFGSVQGLNAVLGLVGDNSKEVSKTQKELENSAGATEKAFSKYADSLAVARRRLEELKNQALVSLYEAFSPLVNTILDMTSAFFEMV